jgi:hypothetical protein
VRPGLVAVAVALALPATASAGSVTVTNDAGQPAALPENGTLQIRHMAPTVTPTLDPTAKPHPLIVPGPDGMTAGVDAVCVSADGAGPQTIRYAGNGAYAVKLVTWSDPNDFSCEGTATTQNFTVVIAASVTLTGPPSPLLYRDPGKGEKDFTFTYDVNPGAERYLIAWAYNPTFGPTGAVSGADYQERGLTGPFGPVTDIRFKHAGTVSVVAAAQSMFEVSSPFSAPVTLKLIGPFDWSSTPGITSSRGRTYTIGGEIAEPGVVGKKVSVLLAKGKGKFKSFTSKTIPSSRKFSFKIKKPRGKYRLKYVFMGADLVAAGAYTQTFTVKKSSASLGNLKRA